MQGDRKDKTPAVNAPNALMSNMARTVGDLDKFKYMIMSKT